MKTLREVMEEANREVSALFMPRSKPKRIRRERVWICSDCGVQTSSAKGKEYYTKKGCDLREYLVNRSTGKKESVTNSTEGA